MRRVVSVAAVFVVAVSLVAQDKKQDKRKDPDQIGNRDVGKGVNFYSIQKEIALGKQLAQQVAASAKVVDDPVIAEYVNRLGQNLGRNSDAKFPLTTKVIESDEINALSLPGGYLFVNTGLILSAATEAELAGAMAHEIAHIAARHGTRQATREQIGGLATIPLIFIGGWPGYGARQGAGAMIPVGMLAFQRSFESEADLLGIQYLYKTGYDPEGMVDIFEKIEALNQRQPGKVSRYFSSHPPTGDRIVSVQKNIQALLKEQPQYVVSTSEFGEVQTRLLQTQRKAAPQDSNQPTLRRAPNPKLAESPKPDGSGACPSL
jgi:predicted Zn-dependent protease